MMVVVMVVVVVVCMWWCVWLVCGVCGVCCVCGGAGAGAGAGTCLHCCSIAAAHGIIIITHLICVVSVSASSGSPNLSWLM